MERCAAIEALGFLVSVLFGFLFVGFVGFGVPPPPQRANILGNLPRWLETEMDMPKHGARWTLLPAAACQLASPAGCFIR